MNNIRLKVKMTISVWSGDDLEEYEKNSISSKIHRKPDANISVNVGRHSQIEKGKERKFVSEHLYGIFKDSIDVIPSLIDQELAQKDKK
jgi:hypothetical protein